MQKYSTRNNRCLLFFGFKIGKSIDVKKRISQHLYKGRKRLLSAYCKIRVVPMHSELEALLFESKKI